MLVSVAPVALRVTLDRVSTSSTHPNERELVARVATDANAFAELYRHYLPRVHAYAFRRTGDRQAAEDICSATFEAAFRNIANHRPTDAGLGPWLFRIAARKTVDHHRREGRSGSERGQVAMSRLAPGVAPAADGSLHDDDSLRLAINQLRPRYQEAITLRHLAHLDTAEAAEAMGVSKSAFSVILTRATKALRRELDRIQGAEQ